MKNNFGFILVKPQLGENIGAVARAMANFNLFKLRIVSPRDGWPNNKAYRSAAGASVIIDGRVEHALLLELFTEHGAGTLIQK